jgi:hypothetical protein
VGAHAVLCRRRLPFGTVARFVVAGLASSAALVWLLDRSYGIWSLKTFAGVFAFAFLCEPYLFLFTLVMASISVKLLLLLRDNSLSEDEVIAAYDSERMVSLRIERLVAAGLLCECAKRLRLTASGVLVAARFLSLRTYFGLLDPADDPTRLGGSPADKEGSPLRSSRDLHD